MRLHSCFAEAHAPQDVVDGLAGDVRAERGARRLRVDPRDPSQAHQPPLGCPQLLDTPPEQPQRDLDARVGGVSLPAPRRGDRDGRVSCAGVARAPLGQAGMQAWVRGAWVRGYSACLAAQRVRQGSSRARAAFAGPSAGGCLQGHSQGRVQGRAPPSLSSQACPQCALVVCCLHRPPQARAAAWGREARRRVRVELGDDFVGSIDHGTRGARLGRKPSLLRLQREALEQQATNLV